MYLTKVLFVASLIFLSSCSTVDSDNLKSSGFYANIIISSTTPDTTEVKATLRTSSAFNSDYIDLSPSDVLTVNSNGAAKVLRYNKDLFGNVSYINSYNFNIDDNKFVVALDRNEGTDMPNSWVTMPKSFYIAMPYKNQLFNYNDTISAIWTPSYSQPITVQYSATCKAGVDNRRVNFYRSFYITDLGMHDISAKDIFANSPNFASVTPQLCNAKITITRTNEGTIDSHYGQGGRIVAQQIREINFLLNVKEGK